MRKEAGEAFDDLVVHGGEEVVEPVDGFGQDHWVLEVQLAEVHHNGAGLASTPPLPMRWRRSPSETGWVTMGWGGTGLVSRSAVRGGDRHFAVWRFWSRVT